MQETAESPPGSLLPAWGLAEPPWLEDTICPLSGLLLHASRTDGQRGTGIKNLKAPRIHQAFDHAGKLLQLEESHLHQKGVKPAAEIRIRGWRGGWDVMRIGTNMRLRQKS